MGFPVLSHHTVFVTKTNRVSHCIDLSSHQDMDTWYRSKFEDLSGTATKHVESMQSARDEISGRKRDVSVLFY